MKILLINPANPESSGRDLYSGEILSAFARFKPLVPNYFGLPLALTTLAGLTPREHKVRIVDESIEPIDFDEPCDLVGITAMTFKAKRAYAIAREFRRRGVRVVMGGIHASMLPTEAARHVDCVAVGEADEIWPTIVEDAEHNRLAPRYVASRLPDVKRLPAPRYEVARYRRYANIYLQTARGCPYDCEFCTVTRMCGRRMRLKTPEQVIEEIDTVLALKPMTPALLKRRLDGRYRVFKGSIFFVDDNFAIDRQHALAVCKAIKEYQDRKRVIFEWFTQVNFRVGLDTELLEALRDAHCKRLFMGFESLDPASLAAMNKKMNDPALYGEAIAGVRRHGMEVVFSTILGADGDTAASAERTAEFIERHNIFFVLPNILTPYPGTKLYERMLREDRITSHDWDLYNIRNVVIRPARMSGRELEESYRNLCERIFSFDAMLERGKNALGVGPSSTFLWFQRPQIVMLFAITALILFAQRRLSWRVASRVITGVARDFLVRGTIESAWLQYGVSADYHCFAVAESQRLRDVCRSETLQPRRVEARQTATSRQADEAA